MLPLRSCSHYSIKGFLRCACECVDPDESTDQLEAGRVVEWNDQPQKEREPQKHPERANSPGDFQSHGPTSKKSL